MAHSGLKNLILRPVAAETRPSRPHVSFQLKIKFWFLRFQMPGIAIRFRFDSRCRRTQMQSSWWDDGDENLQPRSRCQVRNAEKEEMLELDNKKPTDPPSSPCHHGKTSRSCVECARIQASSRGPWVLHAFPRSQMLSCLCMLNV